MEIVFGILIPFAGTAFGAFLIFFLKGKVQAWMEQSLMGFASGVMVAAAVWSLLLPALELEIKRGRFSFVPAAIGFFGGIFFLVGTDRLVSWLEKKEYRWSVEYRKDWKKNLLLVFAVTVHNIPEGLSVGAAFAGFCSGIEGITMASAYALAVGIGIQNIPEGFIVALPFRNQGISRKRSFVWGALSGAVEPLASVAMILLTRWLQPLLSYLLAFSAGAMFYVVMEELIPDAVKKCHYGIWGFCAGFLVMMILDVALK